MRRIRMTEGVSIKNFQFLIAGILVMVYVYATDAFDTFYRFTETYASDAGNLIMCLFILGFFLALHFEQMYYETRIATERAESEKKVQMERDRDLLRTLIDNLPDTYIFIKDPESRFVVTNAAHLRALRAETLEEVVGKTDFDFFPKELAEQYYRDEKKVIESNQALLNREELLIDQTGERKWFLTTKVPLHDVSGSVIGLVGMSRDITEHKLLEKEKGRMQAQLLQSQKMEAIGILTGGIAHDFNNLMTPILGYTDLAMMKVDETNTLYGDLKRVRDAATRAADLTRQLLLFSRKQPMEFIPLNINRVIEDLLKMLDRFIGEDVMIETELEDDLWTVSADAGNIQQVIMNLAVNARDAMAKGGRLTIRTENVYIDEDYCRTYGYAHPGKTVCLSVEDTGVGMDKETVRHVFEPFFTTKEVGKGTGLGLSVVYGIIKEHEGWINVYSEPGQGSTFKAYLPAFSVRVEAEPEETVPMGELQGRGERILLVEDDRRVREFAVSVLTGNGYIVFDAANSQEALNVFERESGDFHLALVDVVLPDRHGLELAKQLLTREEKLRIMFTSGYADEKSRWPDIRRKGFRFIRKPYTSAEILQVVKEAMERS